MKFVTSDKIREANRHFFEESGIRNNKSQKQHPYLVLRPTKTRINVDLFYTAEELLELPDNTRVLSQWKGKTRSDYFEFKVSDFKKYIEENPPKQKQKI